MDPLRNIQNPHWESRTIPPTNTSSREMMISKPGRRRLSGAARKRRKRELAQGLLPDLSQIYDQPRFDAPSCDRLSYDGLSFDGPSFNESSFVGPIYDREQERVLLRSPRGPTELCSQTRDWLENAEEAERHTLNRLSGRLILSNPAGQMGDMFLRQPIREADDRELYQGTRDRFLREPICEADDRELYERTRDMFLMAAVREAEEMQLYERTTDRALQEPVREAHDRELYQRTRDMFLRERMHEADERELYERTRDRAFQVPVREGNDRDMYQITTDRNLSEPVHEAYTGGPNMKTRPPRIRMSGSARRRRKRQLVEGRLAGETPKRPHFESSLPNDVIKQEVLPGDPTVSCSQIIQPNLRMAIVLEGFPQVKLDCDQANAIEAELERKIDELPPDETVPVFEGCRYKNNALIVVCSDEVARGWLQRAVVQLRPWEGARLKLVNSRRIPRPVKLIAWIPGVFVEPAAALRRIAVQNPTLRAEGWAIIDVKAGKKFTQIVVTADPGVADALRKLGCKPHYGLKRINIKILKKREDLE